MKKIFQITGSDKREELLKALEDGESFISQALGGRDIEAFDDEHGFVLLEKEKSYLPTNLAVLRTKAAIEVYSLLGRSSLRTGYYTCRQKPEFASFFEGTKNFNNVWLDTISRQLEILCDIDRDVLTFGTPDGTIFYPYSKKFGSKETMIALSEDIATTHLKDSEIKHCMNILIDEKMSNALEVINDKHDFLRMLNMAVATRGGRFNRSILKLINRFDNQKNVLLWTDADTFGCDIRGVAIRGSKNLRHQTPTQTSKNAFDVGLFPSVAESLDVPVDIDEKRPMSGDEKTGSHKLVEHLKNAGLDSRDLQTFYNDHTYEIEGLHSKFTDKQNKPIGTQIYLVEYLRSMKLDCKPQLPEDDKALKDELMVSLEDLLRKRLRNKLNVEVDTSVIDNLIKDFREQKVEQILLEEKNKILHLINSLSANKVRDKINNWYCAHPKSEMYTLSEIANEMVEKLELTLTFENLQTEIDELAQKIQLKLDCAKVNSSIEITDFKKVEFVQDYYDVVLKRLGAKKEDILAIRQALQKRLGDEE